MRSLTIAGTKDLTRAEVEEAKRIALEDLPTLPKTRGECLNGVRPCPFASCRHHLFLDVNAETGSIKLNYPHLEIDEMKETCSLDVADRGEHTLEEVADLFGMTRERVRQVQDGLLRRLGVTHDDAMQRHPPHAGARGGADAGERAPAGASADYL